MNRSALIRSALAAALLLSSALAHGQREATDRPARRLQISVRFDSSASGAERVDQRVQVLEGSHAMIYTGQSQPIRERRYIQTPGGVVSQEVTVLQDTRMGFEVVPRLAGSRVQVDIAGANGYASASGPLGQWFELGAVATATGSRRVWIRVEPL